LKPAGVVQWPLLDILLFLTHCPTFSKSEDDRKSLLRFLKCLLWVVPKPNTPFPAENDCDIVDEEGDAHNGHHVTNLHLRGPI